MSNNKTTDIVNINTLLDMDIDIPNYQRPYQWTTKNIQDLLNDIATAIKDGCLYATHRIQLLGLPVMAKEWR